MCVGMVILLLHHKHLSDEDEFVIYDTKRKHFGEDDSGDDEDDVARYRGGKRDQSSDDDDADCNETEVGDAPTTGMPKKARLEQYLQTGEYIGEPNDGKVRACLPSQHVNPSGPQRLPASTMNRASRYRKSYRSVAPAPNIIDVPQGPSMYSKQSTAKRDYTHSMLKSKGSKYEACFPSRKAIRTKSSCCGDGDVMELLPDGRDAGTCVLVKNRQNAADLMRRCATPLITESYRNSNYRSSKYPSVYQSPSYTSVTPPRPPPPNFTHAQPPSQSNCQPCQTSLHDFSKKTGKRTVLAGPGIETQICPHNFTPGKTACCSPLGAGIGTCCAPSHPDRDTGYCPQVPEVCVLDDKKFDLCPKPLIPPCGHIECAAPVELDAPRRVDIRILERPPPREHEIKHTHFDNRTNLSTRYGVPPVPDTPCCHYSK